MPTISAQPSIEVWPEEKYSTNELSGAEQISEETSHPPTAAAPVVGLPISPKRQIAPIIGTASAFQILNQDYLHQISKPNAIVRPVRRFEPPFLGPSEGGRGGAGDTNKLIAKIESQIVQPFEKGSLNRRKLDFDNFTKELDAKLRRLQQKDCITKSSSKNGSNQETLNKRPLFITTVPKGIFLQPTKDLPPITSKRIYAFSSRPRIFSNHNGPYVKDKYQSSRTIKENATGFNALKAFAGYNLTNKTRSVGERFNMAKSTLSYAFVKVVDSLNNLSQQVIKWPTSQERIEIEDGFRRMGGLRKVVGAIDGTYIRIDALREHPVDYINRKRYHSITLQAICDNRLKFTDCFVGYPSSVHDCRIFRNSDLYKDVRRNSQKYFADGQLILGDKAYPSLMWCLVPFKDNGILTVEQKIFNQQHSKTRQTIERSFALLFGRFRRLKHLHMQCMDYIPKAVLAACVLHNICLDFSDDLSFMDHLSNTDGENMEAETLSSFQENSDEALQLRQRLCDEL